MVGSFGDGGRYPGTFYSVGSVAVDSKGNVYTGETLEGKRVQKFMPEGSGTMIARRNVLIGCSFAAALLALGIVERRLEQAVSRAGRP